MIENVCSRNAYKLRIATFLAQDENKNTNKCRNPSDFLAIFQDSRTFYKITLIVLPVLLDFVIQTFV